MSNGLAAGGQRLCGGQRIDGIDAYTVSVRANTWLEQIGSAACVTAPLEQQILRRASPFSFRSGRITAGQPVIRSGSRFSW